MKDNLIEDKPIENCTTCGVILNNGNWSKSWRSSGRKQCTDCSKNYNTSSNKNRMWVNGKYIPQSHPLYKAGNYKSFGDAAFSLLEKRQGTKDGYVYAIINPAWPDWVKIGMAVDAEDRLNGYQTSSPMRDYKLIHSVYFKNRSKAERNAHKLAGKIAERKGEWFNISNEQAIKVLEEVSDG